ncbi:alkylation response protein AidB-like acyl-CoA dehydrogenase [Camelimonas lactis]|uniref:Alkylation response protein AidB-like acyl-CoA dehydrogenase n=2 Tax=Camelimonas lactis TaxID=659006 RepID=A0A4R2GRL2_9HYPH|nr:alkylation response protein AidB-like acyl-CoA dehydrogenase [Camelimonas lactis]
MTQVMTHEERTALRDSVRRLLADRCAEADVRRLMDTDTGHDAALWRALADLGVAGMLVGEAHGGSGLGPVELELVMEEIGAALSSAPMISTAIAAKLLDGDRARALAAGELIVAVAPLGAWDWTGQSAVRISNGRAQGVARFTPDGQIADLALLAGEDGVYAVERAAFTATPLPVFDRTRRLADLHIDGPVERICDGSRVAGALAVGLVALAGDQAGGARRVLDFTVEYARERRQFGRAIGSFQAIKHMAADLLLEAESATSAARHAAAQLAGDGADREVALALAGFACADAYVRCAKDGVQMHGGIAFTWEHPAHLYLRRARSGAQLFGDSRHWRERFIQALEARS